MVQPDLLFIRRERRGVFSSDAVEGPPDLVIEILSPSTHAYDEGHKAKLFAEAGVPEFWLADPFAGTLRVFVLIDGAYHEVPHEHSVVRSVVLPGLAVDVAALFADLG